MGRLRRRIACGHALRRIVQYEGDHNIAGLLAALESPLVVGMVSVAGEAALALARLKQVQHTPRIRPLLDSPHAADRFAAVRALGELNDREAATSIKRLLADARPGVRAASAMSLALLGQTDAIDAIWKVAQSDPERGVRNDALRSLVILGDEDAI